MFQIGDLSLFLAGGLTCIGRGDLFVSWQPRPQCFSLKKWVIF